MFAQAVATHGNCNFIKVSPDDVLGMRLGDSEKKMRAYLNFAKEKAAQLGNTSVLFFEECNRLLRKPGKNHCEVTANITAIIQECLSGAADVEGRIVVLATTNHPEQMPIAIRSRMKMIEVELPGPSERIAILQSELAKQTKNLRSNLQDCDFSYIADSTEGASGRDLKSLVENAMNIRVEATKRHNGRWCKDVEDFFVPCSHPRREDCKSPQQFAWGDQPQRARTPPLSLHHFEGAIKQYGVSPIDE